jgi:hypothetical protein
LCADLGQLERDVIREIKRQRLSPQRVAELTGQVAKVRHSNGT